MQRELRGLVKMLRQPGFWTAAMESATALRALKVAVVVGTALVLINQGDLLFRGQLPPLWKLLLTYCVPYGVSTYSAAAFKVDYRQS